MNSDFIIYFLIIVLFMILIYKKFSQCDDKNEYDFEVIHPGSVRTSTFY
jgi:hypothetical protein